jgi:sec-independent protein translocase protein TatA
MGLSGWWHWLIVILVLVLLFGTGKISGLMGDLAKGIKSFKKEMADGGEEPEEPARPETKAIEHKAAKPAPKTASRAKAPRKQKSG